MKGGIKAWNGLKAEGYPEVAMNYFGAAASTEELVVLAWLLEEATRKLYRNISEALRDQSLILLFHDLAQGEEQHKSVLEGLYMEFAAGTAAAGIEGHRLSQSKGGDLTEGGVRLDEALQWLRGRKERDILEFAVSLEANAYDRYLTMWRLIENERSKRVFESLFRAEKQHLERLIEAFEGTL
ncbi:MAG: ferritin family protein [Desulforhabdus sp.]|jgi:rubrerythrin|nr:ferritin family protein [Desulforhabdus sp.]